MLSASGQSAAKGVVAGDIIFAIGDTVRGYGTHGQSSCPFIGARRFMRKAPLCASTTPLTMLFFNAASPIPRPRRRVRVCRVRVCHVRVCRARACHAYGQVLTKGLGHGSVGELVKATPRPFPMDFLPEGSDPEAFAAHEVCAPSRPTRVTQTSPASLSHAHARGGPVGETQERAAPPLTVRFKRVEP